VQETRQKVQHRKERGSRRNDDRRWSGDSREKGMVRLAINAGKAHGIRPGDIVGTIAYHADIPGHVIGAINIRQEHSLVDVPEQFVAKVLDGNYRIRKQPIIVERA
jgi:ATP-dependent RNA helicase DeaD